MELLFVAARGTSDHAAILAKYLFEIELGLPVCLAAPGYQPKVAGRFLVEGQQPNVTFPFDVGIGSPCGSTLG